MANTGLLAHFIRRDRKKQGITKLPSGLTAVGLLLLLTFSIALIYFLAKSVPLKTSVPIKETYASMFQKNLSENCKKLERDGYSGDTYVVEKNLVPFQLSNELTTMNNGAENIFTCNGIDTEDRQGGYISILLKDDYGWFTVYDDFSGSYAHANGTAPYIGSYGTVVKESDDTKITAYLENNYGRLVKGFTQIFLRGEKKLKLSNGETIYASFSKEAVGDDDERLTALLSSYTNDPSESETYSSDANELYEEKIINTFFNDMSDLGSPEREALSQIESVLEGISSK